MFVDSHCHLNMLDLTDFSNNLDEVVTKATQSQVEHLLTVCVDLADVPRLTEIADRYPQVSMSVGIHPNHEQEQVVSARELIKLADIPQCVAIGETGLDYYRTDPGFAQSMQQQQFAEHIKAACALNKPLIIHTREAAKDTIRMMQEEGAHRCGGVMHCFVEDLEVARAAMDLGFYISISGIVSFKNATALHEVVKSLPLNRLLIETDSPYLAPVPFRGKQNHPALVVHVAKAIADLKGITIEELGKHTTENFYQCFPLCKPNIVKIC